MSWLSIFFGKSNNDASSSSNHATDQMVEEDFNVNADIFLNNTPPSEETGQSIENSTSLKAWLEQDFFRKGYEDGYYGHSSEMLENKIKSIKSDFRYNLNLKIDAARQECVKLENHKIDLEGMSDRLVKKIDNQANANRANITELESEIALATKDERLVMIPIHQYRDGFIRGTEAYQEEKLIAGSTGLFN